MSYEIRIVGDMNSTTITNNQGMALKALWEDRKVTNDSVLTFGDTSAKKSQIRSIKKVEDQSASISKNDNVTKDVDRKHLETYRGWLKRSPKERSERVALFKQTYFAVWNEYPSEDILLSLKSELQHFFQENPKRTYGDIPTYVNHLGKAKDRRISTFKNTLFKLLESVVVEDYEMAK